MARRSLTVMRRSCASRSDAAASMAAARASRRSRPGPFERRRSVSESSIKVWIRVSTVFAFAASVGLSGVHDNRVRVRPERSSRNASAAASSRRSTRSIGSDVERIVASSIDRRSALAEAESDVRSDGGSKGVLMPWARIPTRKRGKAMMKCGVINDLILPERCPQQSPPSDSRPAPRR